VTLAARSRLDELKSVLERGGGILGDLYARTARTLLKRLETIQDREAQRRFHRHATRSSPSAGSKKRAAPFASSATV